MLHTPDMPEHSTKDPSASTELDSTCVHKKMLVELIKKTDGGFARVSRRKCVRGTPVRPRDRGPRRGIRADPACWRLAKKLALCRVDVRAPSVSAC